MSSQPQSLGPIKKAWYRWKSLRWVPLRKWFFVGLDLNNTTFWEFRDTISSHQHRMRRIAKFPSPTHHSDVPLTPQWHQWLRHTRADPPSLEELRGDVVRQEQLKVLARRADERWGASLPGLGEGEGLRGMGEVEVREVKERAVPETGEGPNSGEERKVAATDKQTLKEGEDPWKQARGGPSEEWQPNAWDASRVTPARR